MCILQCLNAFVKWSIVRLNEKLEELEKETTIHCTDFGVVLQGLIRISV